MKPSLRIVAPSETPEERRERVRERAPFNPAVRGLVVQYHRGSVNHCPVCHRRAWLVGRLMAECSGCGCALPVVGERS